MPLIPEHSGWMIENDELKPIPYEGQGFPTIDAQAVSSDTGTDEPDMESGDDNESDDENHNESSASDDDVISAEDDDDSDGELI